MHKFIIPFLALIILYGCGGSAGESFPPSDTGFNSGDVGRTYPEDPLSCNIDDMRQWVDANMRDYYLFYSQVPLLKLSNYSTLADLITDLRVTPNDRFSNISDASQSSAHFDEGILFGFGHTVAVTSQNELRVTQVYSSSPFALANIQRGDYIERINGVGPFSASVQDVRDFFGVDGNVVTMAFDIRKPSGQTSTETLTSTSFTVDTVTYSQIYSTSGVKTGYVAFDSFLETSESELDVVFENFAENAIDELILDLRYNRGGRVTVANKLASLIIGDAGTDNIFTTFAQNDKYAELSESIRFNTEAHALSISRVVVLTTADTCSASELVINGLRPYMDVVVIGNTTCGKPYGSSGRIACGKQMNALQYQFVNAAGAGGYYSGLSADCIVDDDLDQIIGNTSEEMLGAALSYINTGSCGLSANRQGQLQGQLQGQRRAISASKLWAPFDSSPNLLPGRRATNQDK